MVFEFSCTDFTNLIFFLFTISDRENYDGVGDRHKPEGGRVGRDTGSWQQVVSPVWSRLHRNEEPWEQLLPQLHHAGPLLYPRLQGEVGRRTVTAFSLTVVKLLFYGMF